MTEGISVQSPDIIRIAVMRWERIPELWEFTRYRRKPVRDEFYDYKRDILLNVELGKSHFVLQKKEENEAVRKFCRSLKKENGQLTHQLSGEGALFFFLKI